MITAEHHDTSVRQPESHDSDGRHIISGCASPDRRSDGGRQVGPGSHDHDTSVRQSHDSDGRHMGATPPTGAAMEGDRSGPGHINMTPETVAVT